MSSESAGNWDVERIVAETFVSQVELHDELPSTNDRALALATKDDIDLPFLIIAERQTRGRGRGGNEWWSSAGSLTFSLLLELDAEQLPTSRWPEMSLTVGSSICTALANHLPGKDVRLKWPNDVFLCGAKVCGVLVEIPPQTPGRVVIGVGLNVNNSVTSAPSELAGRAIAMCDVAGAQSPEHVLINVLQAFAEQLDELTANPESVRRRWRRFDLLLGQSVTIADGISTTTGTGVGIDDDGALLLRTEAGTNRCYSGVVQTFG